MEEIWKDVKDFENYKVSNLGNVKSLNYARQGDEKKLRSSITNSGYKYVTLSKKNVKKSLTIHRLVYEAFFGEIEIGKVINHINHNRLDNRLHNLEKVTQRENANQKHLKSSSDYVGVSWNKKHKKWLSYITINGKNKYLGSFENEIDAANAYNYKLKEINKCQYSKQK